MASEKDASTLEAAELDVFSEDDAVYVDEVEAAGLGDGPDQELAAVDELQQIRDKYMEGFASLPPPTLEGYLKKASPSRFRGWQRRYFRLFEDALCWSKAPEDPFPLGSLPLFTIESLAMPPKKPQRLNLFIGAERKIALRCDSEDERKEWGLKVNELIFKGKSSYKDAQGLGRYWKAENVAEELSPQGSLKRALTRGARAVTSQTSPLARFKKRPSGGPKPLTG